MSDAKSELQRNVADFDPNIWGDYFLQYVSDFDPVELDQNMVAKIETLKSDVRNILVSKTEKSLDKVHLIDSIYRLGVSYHFEHEIEQVIQHIYNNYVENGEITIEDNLCFIAMLFRLLRQQGFHVSSNVFNKFKDEQGNFIETLIKDVDGMLSLYEATHMMVHGDNILEEALTFTTTHLEAIANQLNHPHAIQVKNSLRQPLYKKFPKLEARSYISIYEQDTFHNEKLLILAKLDFNMLQKLHQKEFGNVHKWWKELDVPNKLPYARDRITESCFWALSINLEPQFSTTRQILSKLVSIMTIIDDTYDAYGTIDELELFTDAIERLDISCLDNLPDYMKFLYKIILDFCEEIKLEMKNSGKVYALNYHVKELKKYIQAYMKEAKWLKSNYEPTLEEYIHLSLETYGYVYFVTTCYMGMGVTATENILKWVTNEPKIVNASALINRLMNDIVTNELEQKREHVPTFLECYMRQYNVSREAAIQEGRKRISDAWKDINKECLKPYEVPKCFLNCIINLTRFSDFVYQDRDDYTHPEGKMKTIIQALLVDPVPI